MKQALTQQILGICLCSALFVPSPSWAMAKPFNLKCEAVRSSETTPVLKAVKGFPNDKTQFNPVDLLISVAINQRYNQQFTVYDVHASVLQSDGVDIDPLYPNFKGLKKIINLMGYQAKGFKLEGLANEIRTGDVGFLLDTHVRFDQSPVITLLFATADDKRYLLYGDGVVCPMNTTQFSQYFRKSAFLRLN